MGGLANAVDASRDVQRELVVGIDIDHRSIPQRLLQPDAHGTLHVLAVAPRRVVIVIIVTAAHEHPYIDLVVSLVQDDPAYTAVISTERDSQLELADAPFPEAKRAPDSSPAFRGPLLEPLLVGFRIKLDDWLAVPVGRPALPPRKRLRVGVGWLVERSISHVSILRHEMRFGRNRELVLTKNLLSGTES
jgi:hypothetical protein